MIFPISASQVAKIARHEPLMPSVGMIFSNFKNWGKMNHLNLTHLVDHTQNLGCDPQPEETLPCSVRGEWELRRRRRVERARLLWDCRVAGLGSWWRGIPASLCTDAVWF
jgi:hypothetical protein